MIKIKNNNLSGDVEAISSKSFAHRIILCATLSDKETKIHINELSKDILATISCAESLGAKVYFSSNQIQIKPIDLNYLNQEDKKIFFCNESGTTYRFIVPIASSLYKRTKFSTEGILSKRPMDELLHLMEESGCKIKYYDKLMIDGKFHFEDVQIRGDISSQYISALLLASVLQSKNPKISVLNSLESSSYVDITMDIMKKFGISVHEEKNIFKVESQKYISPREIVVEGDWSNSAFFLVAGAFSKIGIKVKNLNFSSMQGDREIINILKNYGANIEIFDDGILVKKALAKPFEVDITNIPDLAPVLAVLASGAKGVSKIKNIKRLRLKESDRVQSTIDMIIKLGGIAFEEGENIVIVGNGILEGGKVDSYNDHRIAMSTCIASILCKNSVVLSRENAIEKSYPSFLKDFISLGGNYVIYNG